MPWSSGARAPLWYTRGLPRPATARADRNELLLSELTWSCLLVLISKTFARVDHRMSAFIPDFFSNGILSIESLRIPYHRLRKRLPGCGSSRPGPYWRYHWFWTQKVFVPLSVILHCS